MDEKKIEKLLTDKYHDYRMHFRDVAAELGIDPRTAANQRAQGMFPIATFVLGRQRYCTIEDVARYFARIITMAREEHAALRRRLGFDC